jgi:hypothetical protein
MICLAGASSQMADPKREGPIEKERIEERLLLACVCSPHPSRTIALARRLLTAPAGASLRRLTASVARCYERTLILGSDENREFPSSRGTLATWVGIFSPALARSPCRRMFCNVKRRKLT